MPFFREHSRTFTRAAAASIIATAAEFVALALLAHVARVPHWIDYAVVQFLGTLITFVLYRHWAFEASDGGVFFQGAKSVIVFVVSFVLNTGLPSIGSYVLGREPVLSFAVSQAVVYVCWNYPMNHYWVFKRQTL